MRSFLCASKLCTNMLGHLHTGTSSMPGENCNLRTPIRSALLNARSGFSEINGQRRREEFCWPFHDTGRTCFPNSILRRYSPSGVYEFARNQQLRTSGLSHSVSVCYNEWSGNSRRNLSYGNPSRKKHKCSLIGVTCHSAI